MGRMNHGLYERPFGRLPGIGLGLALFLYAAAVMLVLNRLIPARLPEEAAQRYAQSAGLWTAVAFGAGTFCLYGIAVKLTDSIVDMAAFLLGAAAAVCRILGALLPRLGLEAPMAVPAPNRIPALRLTNPWASFISPPQRDRGNMATKLVPTETPGESPQSPTMTDVIMAPPPIPSTPARIPVTRPKMQSGRRV